ncbi:MAG: hypothetical protein WKG52_01870 [Variovorax sp.]
MTSPTDKDAPPASEQTPAQKAMKQFSKTDAERDGAADADAPVGPNDGPTLTTGTEPSAPGAKK